MLLRFMMLSLPRGGRTKGLAVALRPRPRPRAGPFVVDSGLVVVRRLPAQAVGEHSNAFEHRSRAESGSSRSGARGSGWSIGDELREDLVRDGLAHHEA